MFYAFFSKVRIGGDGGWLLVNLNGMHMLPMRSYDADIIAVLVVDWGILASFVKLCRCFLCTLSTVKLSKNEG